MERPLAYLKNLADNWLIGYDSRQFQHIAEELYLELIQLSECGKPPKIILAEPDPVWFLAGFIAACAADCQIFLCNPNWVKSEWQQVFDLVQPDVIWNGGMENRGGGRGGEGGNRGSRGSRSERERILSSHSRTPPLPHSPPPPFPTDNDSHWWFVGTNKVCYPHLGNSDGVCGRI